MTVPIPSRIIRLVFSELICLKLAETSAFEPIGIAYQNAIRVCPFGREMVDRAFDAIINYGMLESNNIGNSLLGSQYKFTERGRMLIAKGNYEEVFKKSITTRDFLFTQNGEYGFSDIYEMHDSKWQLLNLEIDIDSITSKYFEIASHLNYQIWKEENLVKIAAKYLGHTRMVEFPSGLITKLKLEIFEKGKEASMIKLKIADSNLRGVLMDGKINEYNSVNFKQRIWAIENIIIPKFFNILDCELVSTNRFIN